MGGVVEADVIGDIDESRIRMLDERLGFFHAQLGVGLRGRGSGLDHEQSFQLATGEPDGIGDVVDGKLIVDVLFHQDQRRAKARILEIPFQRPSGLNIGLSASPLDLQYLQRITLSVRADVQPDQMGRHVGGAAATRAGTAALVESVYPLGLDWVFRKPFPVGLVVQPAYAGFVGPHQPEICENERSDRKSVV